MLICTLAVAWVVPVALSGCAAENESDGSVELSEVDATMVPIEFDGNDAGRLLRFYFGSFMGPHGGDPVAAGILEKREKSWYLRNPESLDGLPGVLLELYKSSLEVGGLSEDALDAFVQSNYYQVRGFPESLDEAKLQYGSWTEPDWFKIDVQGSMVPLRRSTWVRRVDIESALDRMEALDDPVIYDQATLFVGEHLDGDRVVETTLMLKRADGFWDYWAYDQEGRLTDIIRKEPRDMLVPTRCTGCHYGDRLFEPERSFPGMARPGPSGERMLFIPESWRDGDLTASIQEHARRSDTVLGLYATLYLAEAAAMARSTDSKPSPYLERFGIESSP